MIMLYLESVISIKEVAYVNERGRFIEHINSFQDSEGEKGTEEKSGRMKLFIVEIIQIFKTCRTHKWI